MKIDYFVAIADYFNNNKDLVLNGISGAELFEFASREVEKLEKQIKSKDLCDKLAEVLTEEPQTIAEITAIINDDEISRNKITYWLNKMAADGKAIKSEKVIKEEGSRSRKLKAYNLPV